MKPRLPFVVSFLCVALFAGLVVASPDYSPLRDAIPFAPGAASSSIIPTPTDTHDLGSATNKWKELHVSDGVTFGSFPYRLRANPADSGRLEIVDGAGNFTQLRLSRILGERANGGLTAFEFNIVSNASSLNLNNVGHLGFSSSLSGAVSDSDTRLVRKAAGTLGIYSGATLGTNPGALQFGNNTIASAAADGNLLLTNNAGTDFGLLQFGGTTSAFPALQRTGTGLRVFTADAGANGDFSAGNFTSHSGSTKILSFGQTEGGMSIGSASALNWTSGVDAVATAPDIGLARNAAGVLRITNGSTGVGNLLMDDLIQFGGTTSGFASIRAEAGPSIGIKNADNSSYIPMTSSRFNALSGATVKIDANPAAGFMLANDQAIRMSSGADARIDTDSGIARHAVGTVRITDGSTGYGQITGRIVNSVSATPTEPYACAAATAGGMVYVDDTNDTAVSRMCFCGTTADDTTYDWLQVNDPTAACPSF